MLLQNTDVIDVPDLANSAVGLSVQIIAGVAMESANEVTEAII